MATVAERIELLHNNLAHVEAMGGEKKVEKQHAKGKLTARERLALLFDEGSFVEVNALVKSRCYNFGQEKKDLPGEGVVTGLWYCRRKTRIRICPGLHGRRRLPW